MKTDRSSGLHMANEPVIRNGNLKKNPWSQKPANYLKGPYLQKLQDRGV